jgi:hypothetical protein
LLEPKHARPKNHVYVRSSKTAWKIMQNYAGILAASSWDNLFNKEFVKKLGAVIVKLHRKRAEYKNQLEKQSVP